MNITGPQNGTHAPVFPGCGGDLISATPAPVPDSVIIVAVVESLITLIGLLGNAIVIFVLVMAKDRQDTSSVTYVLNLAVADFCFLGTVPFKIAQMIASRWVVGEFMCKLTGGLVTYLNFLVSPLFLMVMSIDRYLAVNKAVSSGKLRAPKTSRIVSIVVWVVAGCAVLPLAFLHTTLPEEQRCKPMFPGSKVSPLFDADPCAYQECIFNYTASATSRMSTKGLLANASDDPNHSDLPLLRLKREVESTTLGPKGHKVRRKNRVRPTTRRKGQRRNKKKSRNKNRYSTKSVTATAKPDNPNLRKQKHKNKNRFDSELYRIPGIKSPVATIKPDENTDNKDDISKTIDKASTPPLPAFGKPDTTFIPTDPDFSTPKGPQGQRAIPVLLEVHSYASVTDSSPAAGDGSGGFSGEPHIAFSREAAEACAYILPLPPPVALHQCIHTDDSSSFHIWVVINFFYSYVIPCTIIVVCYAAILRKLYQPSGMLHGQESRARIRRQTMRKKVTLMVATLVISYIVCFTPYYIWQLLKFSGVPVGNLATCSHMERFNELMVYVNSALNPILYTFLSDQFGSKFKLAWRRMLRKTAHNLMVVTPREKNVVTSRKDESPANQHTPMIPRDSDNTSENCNASNNMISSRPIKTPDDASRPIKTDQNLNVKMEDGATPTIRISADSDNREGQYNDGTAYGSSVRTPSTAAYGEYELQKINSTKQTNLHDSNMSLILERGEVPDGNKRTTRQRHLADDVRPLKSSRPKLFTCVCDCECAHGEECPQCTAEQEELDAACANDVFLAPGDVIDDITPKASPAISGGSMSAVRARWRRMLGRFTPDGERLRNKSTSDRTNSSSSQKNCKKHKKHSRLSKSSGELKNAREEPYMLDVGKWIYSTSVRSDSKYNTEYTAVTTPI